MKNQIEFKVYGKRALFSDPLTRVGGEKCSYQIPTYEALKCRVEKVAKRVVEVSKKGTETVI